MAGKNAIRRRIALKRYDQSTKRKAVNKRYWQSVKGKATRKRYRAKSLKYKGVARRTLISFVVCRCGILFVTQAVGKRTKVFHSQRCRDKFRREAHRQLLRYNGLKHKWKKEVKKWHPELRQARIALASVNRRLKSPSPQNPEVWQSLIEALKREAILPT